MLALANLLSILSQRIPLLNFSLSHHDAYQEECLLKVRLHVVVAHGESVVVLTSVERTAILQYKVSKKRHHICSKVLCHADVVADRIFAPRLFRPQKHLFLHITAALHTKGEQ